VRIGAAKGRVEADLDVRHADIRTTLNIYAKAVPGWESGAAAKLDAFLDGSAAAGGQA